MPYIGKTPTVGNFQVCDAISVVNGQAAYTLQVGGVNVAPESANHMLVSLNGILQKPGSSFTISGSTMTFASNLATGDVIDFVQILGNVLDIGQPSDDTVTAAKLNNDVISGQTELASEPADTDEFLVSDAGTLKRIDYSHIKATGITLADQWHITSAIDTSDSNTDTVITNWTQDGYTGYGKIGTMSESSGIFTFPSTGIYLCELALTFYYNSAASNYNYSRLQITTDNSSYNTRSETTSFTRAAENYVTSSPASAIVDVTNTSNVKVRAVWHVRSSGTNVEGGSIVRSYFKFIRLGDT